MLYLVYQVGSVEVTPGLCNVQGTRYPFPDLQELQECFYRTIGTIGSGGQAKFCWRFTMFARI